MIIFQGGRSHTVQWFQVLRRTGAALTDEPGVIGYCYALYDYLALEPNQLSLRRGDRIAVVSKAGASRGWWKGRLRGKVNPLLQWKLYCLTLLRLHSHWHEYQ